MHTKIMSGKEAVYYGARLIKKGMVVAFPTETVYGLGANVYNSRAISKIFNAKMRPSDNPLIVHIKSINDIYEIAENVTDDVIKLSKAFMPGPFTIILKKKKIIADSVTAGLDTVAIRMPSHQVALDFIDACGVPIAAPSANLSSHISPTTAEHVYNDLKDRIPLIIDGGRCDIGIESTVIDITTNTIRILRPGFITKKMLEDVTGKEIIEQVKVTGTPSSPGMKYRHYTPSIPLRILRSKDEITNLYDTLKSKGLKPIILTAGNINDYDERLILNLGVSSEEVAKNIYSALRDCEKMYDYIITEDYNDDNLGASVMNRLIKASDV